MELPKLKDDEEHYAIPIRKILGRCQYPINVEASGHCPDGEASCERPAISKWYWSDDPSDTMLTCAEHDALVKSQEEDYDDGDKYTEKRD